MTVYPMKTKHTLILTILLAMGVSVSGCAFLRGYAEGQSDTMASIEKRPPAESTLAAAQFLFEDFGSLNTDTLNTNAIPWKVAVAAVLVEKLGDTSSASIEDFNNILKQFGFIFPDNIVTYQGTLAIPIPKSPIGMIKGTIARSIPTVKLEVSNLGCASCHAGRLYDKQGMPTNTLYPGLPNTSLNLDEYIQTVYTSMKNVLRRPDAVVAMMKRVFPDITKDELTTIEKYVFPKVKARYKELEAGIDAPLPFQNGGPGITNGVGALKLRLGIVSMDKKAGEYGYTSIPDLGGTLFRSSLLYDGVYSTPGKPAFQDIKASDINARHRDNLAVITAFFTVPTMGVSPTKARVAIPKVKHVYQFIQHYQPPAFPGKIDLALARMGAHIYQQQCAECHGRYAEWTDDTVLTTPLRLTELPNKLVASADIGTDPYRAATIDVIFADAVNHSAYGDYVKAIPMNGYAAKPLSALWATAPYLHNGSVPTLWALMNPQQRPEKFYVGGHRLDYDNMGIAYRADKNGIMVYPEGYKPWSTPMLYDTTLPGRSNKGHEKEFESLTSAEKKQLMEFLKLL